ncbi:MAG: GNAT family N-acetyltransferase [Ruminococcaceae bacterium]|nr:GNAT family N-acetyltransferase [Oscillospiraceae bacterium]
MIRQLTNVDKEVLTRYLKQVDQDFPIPLSEKVDLEEYSDKILLNGIGFVHIVEENIAGAILFYANDLETKMAYISVLSVSSAYRKRGIAQGLLTTCLQKCEAMGYQTICLHTHKTNYGAISLYEKNGFQRFDDGNRPGDWYLERKL